MGAGVGVVPQAGDTISGGTQEGSKITCREVWKKKNKERKTEKRVLHDNV